MSELSFSDLERIRHQVADAFRVHWKLFLVEGLVMMALGVAAVMLPVIATLAIETFVGWLLLIGGVFRLVSMLSPRQVPGFWLSLLTAGLAVALGMILILQPGQGVLTLTMLLVFLFVVEGVASILIAFKVRRHLPSWRWSNWGWTLFSGMIDLVLAYLIWRGWPSTAAWAIGLLVGINMLFLGLSLVMTAIAARTMASPGR